MAPSLKRHRRAFGRAAELYASDRGFFNEANVASSVNDGGQHSLHSEARRKQNAAAPGDEKSAPLNRRREWNKSRRISLRRQPQLRLADTDPGQNDARQRVSPRLCSISSARR
jgi:hypothetical protein